MAETEQKKKENSIPYEELTKCENRHRMIIYRWDPNTGWACPLCSYKNDDMDTFKKFLKEW